MRTVAFLLGLTTWLATLPSIAAAEDADLPPPRIIRRGVAPPSTLPPSPSPIPPGATAGGPAPALPRPPIPPPPRLPGQGAGPAAAAPVAPLTATPPLAADWAAEDVRAVIAADAGAGGAGYDQGFLIRGAGFSVRVGILLQARFETFEWNQEPPVPGGDRSGFSVPRARLRFSGDAPCSMRYLVELEFGGEGGPLAFADAGAVAPSNLGPLDQTRDYDPLREAWIEYAPSRALRARIGLLRTPATRQLMTRPERQQFVDLALASAWTGASMPGYTDRNRDYGLMLHGVFGGSDQFGWMLTATNGDGGDDVRNVLDRRSSDNLAFGARVNWAFLAPLGFQEGALRQMTNRWYGEAGAWAFSYADRLDMPHSTEGDFVRWGLDLALGYGPWSFTGALTWLDDDDVGGASDDTSTAWLLQAGHHFVGTAFEVAARWSGYETEGDRTGDGTAQEFAGCINYYLNGHGNKVQLDVAYIDTDDGGSLILDPYPAYPGALTGGDSGWLLRFQWQLAL